MSKTQESLCLSAAEVKELTGYARPKQQAEWLRERGYPFEVGGDGVKVLRAYVVTRLGGKMEPTQPVPRLRLP